MTKEEHEALLEKIDKVGVYVEGQMAACARGVGETLHAIIKHLLSEEPDKEILRHDLSLVAGRLQHAKTVLEAEEAIALAAKVIPYTWAYTQEFYDGFEVFSKRLHSQVFGDGKVKVANQLSETDKNDAKEKP